MTPDKNGPLLAVLERLPIAAVISDVTTGVLLRVNGRNMQVLAGVSSPDHLVGRNLLEFIEPRFHRAVRDGRRAILLDCVSLPASPVTLVRIDGTYVETTAQSSFVRWRGEPATQTLMHDLTTIPSD
ncbi:MAG: hypothetical protein ACYC77_04530 [Coriobacteriia bacterium]